MIRLGILGSTGRMGQQVLRLIVQEFADQVQLVAHPTRDENLASLAGCDAIIDFAAPAAVVAYAQEAKGDSLPALIIGSTGWTLDQRKSLEAYATKAPVLMASNFSLGVQAVLEILKTAGPLLDKLGYQPVIVETHHKHKKDSPSGTAISMQRTASPMAPGTVQIHSARAGEVIGDHEITFYGPSDHITLGHFAQDRSIFARGAIQCAIGLANRRATTKGFVSMETYLKEFLK